MPLILNGSSLLKNTSGGLATTTACCCGQNPEECFCPPDYCSYQVSVASPVAMGPLPSLACDLSTASVLREASAAGAFAVCDDADECCGPITSPTGSATYRLYGAGNYFDFQYLGAIDAAAAVQVFLYCDGASSTPPAPQIYADIYLQISVPAAAGLFRRNPSRWISKQAIKVPISSSCGNYSNKQQCIDSPYATRAAVIQTPLEFTVTYSSPGIGSWTSFSDDPVGDQTRVTPCAQELIDDFAVTFRITRRQSCRTVACSCSQSLNGLLASFEGKQFTLGTPGSFSEVIDGAEYFWFYSLGLGGTNVFEYEKYGTAPAGSLVETKKVILYCEQDDSADPPVDRWYALFEQMCVGYDGVGSQTTNAEVGYFQCYESAGCAGRTEGDSIPIGEAVEIEQVEGYPQTPEGLDECTPPVRAQFELVENCG